MKRIFWQTISICMLIAITAFSAGSPILMAQGSPTSVIAIAWSPDGSMIAVGGNNGFLQVRNAATNSVLLNLTGHTQSVAAIAWSPNSQRLASAGGDNTIRVWNISMPQYTPGQLLAAFQGHESTIYSLAWKADGNRLASAAIDEYYTLQIWDVVNYAAQPLTKQAVSNLYKVVWSPNGNQLAVAASAGIFLFDATLNVPSSELAQHRIGPFEVMGSVAWSPNGTTIAGAKRDGTIYLWNAATGAQIATFQVHSNFVAALEWSPDGTRLASTSADGTVKVINASTGATLGSFTGSTTLFLSSIAWSPDGTKIAYGGTGASAQIAQAPLATSTLKLQYYPDPDEAGTIGDAIGPDFNIVSRI